MENDHAVATVHGVNLRVGGDSVVRTFTRDGTFEPEVMDIWTSHAAEGNTLVDVGCYTGLYAIKASMMGAHAIGIEPNSVAFRRATQNAGLNPVTGPLTFRNVALANYVGAGSLYINPKNKMTSAATLLERWPTAFEVNVDTLDSIATFENGIKCIKMDAERSEFPIVLGGMKIIEKTRPTLIIEMLDRELSYLNLSEVLFPLGYKYEELPRSQSVWTPT